MNTDVIQAFIANPLEKFKEHLRIENNERIIFSGNFGTGKTTFLRHFFSEAEQQKNYRKKNYNVVSLYPVNYSIASNEDIFRYVKYDIINDLLENSNRIDNHILEYFETLPSFLLRNVPRLLASILAMEPLLGRNVVEGYERINKLKEEFLSQHKKLSKDISVAKTLEDYIENFQKAEGSVFEDDIVTKAIEEVLKKEKEIDGCENVLLIDDLDRIDPEHIFRLLNVFAAHFDRRNKLVARNKFGFDKVIMVCDVNNLRQIFKAKYGLQTDFNGYIDKFFSHRIFEFNNRAAIRDFAFRLINKAKWSPYQHFDDDSDNFYEFTKERLITKQTFLGDLLTMLVENRQLDLRNILKWNDIPINYRDNVRLHNNSLELEQFPLIFHLQLLAQMKGDAHSLKEAIKECRSKFLYHDRISNYVQNFVYILTIGVHNNRLDSTFTIPYALANTRFKFEIDGDGKNYRLSDFNHQSVSLNEDHLVDAICKTIDLLVAENAFL